MSFFPTKFSYDNHHHKYSSTYFGVVEKWYNIKSTHTILQGKEFLQANVIVWAFDLYFVGRYSHKIQWCLNDA